MEWGGAGDKVCAVVASQFSSQEAFSQKPLHRLSHQLGMGGSGHRSVIKASWSVHPCFGVVVFLYEAGPPCTGAEQRKESKKSGSRTVK